MKNNKLNDNPVKENSQSSRDKSKEHNQVLIYDAIMGSGKTINAIKRMQLYIDNGQRFIFVTPFLKEIKRVQDAIGIYNIETPEPKNEFHKIYIDGSPQKKFKYLNKSEVFLRLVEQGVNIATTHSLFTSLGVVDSNMFKDYILIIDEAIDPISTFKFGARDTEILLNEKLIAMDIGTNKISVTDKQYKDDSFKEVLNFCSGENVYLYNNVFISLLSIEIINSFKQVQILTYLFDSSLMAYYFKFHEINCKFINKINAKLIKVKIKKNLNIYEGAKNQKPGTSRTSFSKNFLTNLNINRVKKIKESIVYLFRYEFQTNSQHSSFTTFKDCKEKYSGRGYTKGFIAINARATNEFVHKKSMAYVGNRYLNPAIFNFFKDKEIFIDQDYWALSELLQWIWRGCIRNNEPMNLYIPSTRMRTLLISWLNDEY